jgi:hypothetical protein
MYFISDIALSLVSQQTMQVLDKKFFQPMDKDLQKLEKNSKRLLQKQRDLIEKMEKLLEQSRATRGLLAPPSSS